ncbi:MAG: PepSY domain-containing protein [Pseudohongiellaceae bacterium]|nr:PepSY domain-containing protein [Pseudohongiellaceae bacterium]
MLTSVLKQKQFPLWAGIALVWLMLATSIASAQTSHHAQQVLAQNSASQGAISQRRALQIVRQKFSGNVVSITEVSRGGGRYYRVRMDDNGNIFTVYVNAANGEVTRE